MRVGQESFSDFSTLSPCSSRGDSSLTVGTLSLQLGKEFMNIGLEDVFEVKDVETTVE